MEFSLQRRQLYAIATNNGLMMIIYNVDTHMFEIDNSTTYYSECNFTSIQQITNDLLLLTLYDDP